MSIAAVAKRAGVSTATVSRVLRGNASVLPGTVRQVQRAIRELCYKPQHRKMHGLESPEEYLKSLKNQSLSVFCAGGVKHVLARPEIEAALRGMNDAASQLGIELQVQSLRNSPKLSGPSGGGILCAGPNDDDDLRVRRLATLIPLVRVMGSKPTRVRMDDVSTDSVGTAGMAVEFLRGRRCTLVIQVTDSSPIAIAQLLGNAFIAAAKNSGMQTASIQIEPDTQPTTASPSKPMACRAIRGLKERITHSKGRVGVFVVGVGLSEKILVNLGGLESRLGKDLFVVACDGDSKRVDRLDPRIACIDPQWHMAGRAALQQLVHRMRNPAAPLVRVQIPAVWSKPCRSH